jgi:4-hydroxythreonine-4-phosphate dehydrogenase
MSSPKKIAITIGDPAGIGPEVVLKAILSEEITDICRPIIIGDYAVVEEVIEKLIPPHPPLVKGGRGGFAAQISNFKEGNREGFLGDIEIVNINEIKDRNFKKCRPTAAGGRACVSYIKKAVELALNKEVDAIVTAPISKESLKMVGFKWPGHTEMLAELTNAKDYAMMFCSDKLKLILVTIHTALRNVPDLVKKEKVLKTIMLAKKACDMMGIDKPQIAVAGLNPHAGESGIFGDEEIKQIIPAVNEAQSMGIPVSGPYPADALFHRAYNGEFDIIVCMYHDQGLISLKMIAFDKAVNVTIGLPIIRTSPDHGTAYDIAWKGIANPSSMIEAIKLAVKLRR